MITNEYILFEKGRILNSEMLEKLQTFSLRNLKIFYQDYSDGIITGFDFIADDSKLYLKPGILKYKDEYFFLSETLEVIDFSQEGGKRYVYLKLIESFENENIVKKEMKLVVCNQLDEGNDIYLGEFKHHQNKKIETNFSSFEDLSSEGNVVNILKRKYAGQNQPTISPIILYLFGMKKIEHGCQSYLENFVINNGLNKEIVSFDILKKYLGEELSFDNYYDLLKDKIKEATKFVASSKKIEKKIEIEKKQSKFSLEY